MNSLKFRTDAKSCWLALAMLLSLDGSLSAAVVLTTLDPAPNAQVPPEPPLEFDFDADGIVDVIIPGGTIQINSLPQAQNRIISINQLGTIYAADLTDGSFIGADPGIGQIWSGGSVPMSACASGGGASACFGNFLGGIEYLGVEFDISGATHYG